MEHTEQIFDEDFYLTFENILSGEDFNEPIADIVELICNRELTRENLKKALSEHQIDRVESIKDDLLDLVLVYIDYVLKDYIITDNEKRNVEFLKKYFKIKEGDFYNRKYYEVEQVLHRQFEKLYFDNNISPQEAEYNFNLQDMFDLSCDQFDRFKGDEICRALDRGASILNLDVSAYPKGYCKKDS